MKAITPEKEIPPAQSTAASGAFPTEQTNEENRHDRADDDVLEQPQGCEASVMKSELKKSTGSNEMNPAIRKPTGDLLPEHLPSHRGSCEPRPTRPARR